MGLPAEHVVALDDHVVTATQLWIFPLRHRRHSPIVQTDTHAERNLVRTIALTHRITDEAAGHGATHGGGRTAIAMTDGVTQQATGHRTDHGAKGRRITLRIYLLHVAHGAALVATTRRTGIHHAVLVVDTPRRLVAGRQRQGGNSGGNEAGLTDEVVHGWRPGE